MNLIARLEYELAYYDSAIHCFNHYTTRTPPYILDKISLPSFAFFFPPFFYNLLINRSSGVQSNSLPYLYYHSGDLIYLILMMPFSTEDFTSGIYFNHIKVVRSIPSCSLKYLFIYVYFLFHFTLFSFYSIFMIHYLPYSQLTLCAKWTYNVHYYRICKEHRNLGIRKHVTASCSGTKPFY